MTKYLRDLVVSIWQCETKYQNQNPVENRYQTVKRHTARTMDQSGAPGAAWFLCLVYICLYLNNCVDPKLSDGTNSPIMMACFGHNDISMLLNFYFWHQFTTFLIRKINHLVLNQKRSKLDGQVLMKRLEPKCVTSLWIMKVER